MIINHFFVSQAHSQLKLCGIRMTQEISKQEVGNGK